VAQFAKSLTTKATKVHEGKNLTRRKQFSMSRAEGVVVQFAKSLTTKATKVHEGNN
jgi:hypothetical protein